MLVHHPRIHGQQPHDDSRPDEDEDEGCQQVQHERKGMGKQQRHDDGRGALEGVAPERSVSRDAHRLREPLRTAERDHHECQERGRHETRGEGVGEERAPDGPQRAGQIARDEELRRGRLPRPEREEAVVASPAGPEA